MSAAWPVLVDGALAAELVEPRATELGVLDTLLLEDGVRWFEDSHVARLRVACAHFGVDVFARFDVEAELARYAAELANAGCARALIRTRAWRDASSGKPRLALDARTPRDVPDAGVVLEPVPTRPDPLGGWKTTARADRERHAARAEADGAFDALLVLPDGAVVEAARGNLFAVVDGGIRTPPLAAGCLPGIVRGLLCGSALGVREEPLDVAALRRASEVWLTSSGVRVAPVRALGARELPGSAGPRAREARATLAALESAYRVRTGAG